MAKIIKAMLNLGQARPDQLIAQAHAVLTGLSGNVNFTNFPFSLEDFKAILDAYSAAAVEAKDGGKKAIALRNQLGESLIRMLRAIAAYVEFHCKDDIHVFLTSGLRPRSTTRPPAQEIDAPKLNGIEQAYPENCVPGSRRFAAQNITRCSTDP